MNDDQDDVPFFASLFDTSFNTFVTDKLIRVFYIILLIGIVIGVLLMVFASFLTNGLWAGLLTLIFSPILFIVLVVMVRVMLEFVVVVFRIADHTQVIAENSEKIEG